MRRYSHLAWSGSHGWVRTVLIVLSLLVLGPLAFGIAMGLFEGVREVLGVSGTSLSWAFRLVTATALHFGAFASLAFTQRAFRRRTIRSYLTTRDRFGRARLYWGGVAGVGIAAVGLVVGLLFGFVEVGNAAVPALWMVSVAFLVTPLQVAVEEVLRGVVLQTILGRTRRGWAGVIGSSLVVSLGALLAVKWFSHPPPQGVVFGIVLIESLLAATVALLDDGLELMIGTRAGVRGGLVFLFGLFPLQVPAPFGLGLVLLVVGAMVGLGAYWRTGRSIYEINDVLRRVEPPPKRSSDSGEMTVDRCLNCGADLVGSYCHNCGQKGVDQNQSLQVLLPEVTDVLFEVDSRIWQTVRLLLFRPGLLTRYYNGGRREAFVRPFRLYIAFSFLFFVALVSFPPGSPNGPFRAWSDTFGEVENGFSDARPPIEVRGPITAVGVSNQTVTVEDIRFQVTPDTEYNDVSALDSLAPGQMIHVEGDRRRDTLIVHSFHLDDPDDQPTMTGPLEYAGEQSLSLLGTSIRITDETRFSGVDSLAALQVGDRVEVDYERSDGILTARQVENADNFVDRIMAAETDALKSLIQNFSRAMFFLVPLFGLLLQALYLRDPYLGHLIFALHEHAFIFFTGMLVVLVGLIPGTWVWIVQVGLGAGIPIYLALSLRTAYDETWLGAVVKSLFLLVVYVNLLLVGIGFTVGYLSL